MLQSICLLLRVAVLISATGLHLSPALSWAAEPSVGHKQPATTYVLPELKEIPVTLDNFCAGLVNNLAVTTQSIATEANLLCSNTTPTELFRTLSQTPYRGVGAPNIVTLSALETEATQTTTLTVAYAIEVNKDPVKTLLGEEQHVLTPYDQGNLNLSASFLPPPENLGDADTAFSIEQRTIVDDNVSFNDVSRHALKLYVLYPDNFKFFVAARTLEAPSEQFQDATVLRAVMQNPNNASTSLSVSILHFEMNSRDQHEEVVETFMRFIEADMLSLYAEQQASN